MIFLKVYGASIVTFPRDNSEINFLFPYLMFHIDNLHTIATRGNIFYLGCG